MHFWAEIYLGNGVWQTIEATPGYEILAPRPGIVKRSLAALKKALLWAIDHAVLLSGLSLLLV